MIENFGDFSFRGVGTPIVDIVEGCLVKRGGVRLRLIPIGVRLQKRRLHVQRVFLKPNGVCNRNFAIFGRRERGRVRVEGAVEFVRLCAE